MAQNIKNVTELDFDQIKTNLKAFLSAQDKFNDYDFDGSGMSILLDILAYNTQYNALLAHTNANESFLDTAQFRANVVSHAKMLGYTPSSATAAKAYLNIVVSGVASDSASIDIPRGQKFQGLIGNRQYQFVTNQSYTAIKDGENKYYFNNVEICEGEIQTFSYRINNKVPNQKFKLPTDMADVETLIVSVRDSLTATNAQVYTHYNSILDVNSSAFAYFLQESYDGQYEIYFGDNVVGHQPVTGQIVDIGFVKTHGSEGNGATTFTIDGSIGGISAIAITKVNGFTRTTTGSDKETTDSIRHNAPKSFASQNRAVTAIDYKAILMAEYDYIEDISVWGGEVNDPPVYGRVFLSIKPKTGEFLSTTSRNIIKQYLAARNVGSVTAEIENPDYTFITMDVFFKYDPNSTARTKGQLETAVRNAIIEYNDTYLEKFDGVLRYSKLLKAIDSVDKGILNSFARLKMHKHVQPQTGFTADYTIKFSSPIYITDTTEQTLSSNNFTFQGQTCTLTDIPKTGAYPNRTVQILNAETDAIVRADAGTIYPTTGKIELKNLLIESSDVILIFADPNSNDIAPKYNQLVSIEQDETPGITVTGEEDTITTLGSAGTSQYTTFSRHE